MYWVAGASARCASIERSRQARLTSASLNTVMIEIGAGRRATVRRLRDAADHAGEREQRTSEQRRLPEPADGGHRRPFGGERAARSRGSGAARAGSPDASADVELVRRLAAARGRPAVQPES